MLAGKFRTIVLFANGESSTMIPQGGTVVDYVIVLAYFVGITLFGVYFGRYAKGTSDYFFGGQRFAWWLIGFSSIATMVGSYSFVKYSEAGFSYGLSSSQSYLNDWFWVPILLVIWLPILYYRRIQSVPEYFDQRFGRSARLAATAFMLVYLVGYIGVNLLTLGKALQPLIGWSVMTGAAVTCAFITAYVMAGGQTSVIMTDLLQGVILLIAGLALFAAGIWQAGGFGPFWEALPRGHRFLFSEWNRPDAFSFIGIYVQDGLANSAAFVLMNQGMIMRFLALRSLRDARKMAVLWILVLSPLAAVAVSGAGWVARALVTQGQLSTTAERAFIDAAEFLCAPGIFGLVLAALLAALMSTADTLINAVAAVAINDIYRPYLAPNREDRHYLLVARLVSLGAAALGLVLVPVMSRGTIYHAHAMFTAAVTPPMVVAILLGMFWTRYNQPAALATLVGGGLLSMVTFIPGVDEILVRPFSFGMGPESYAFTRALFGLVTSVAIGMAVALATRPQPMARLLGLVAGTQLDALRLYKGGAPNLNEGQIVEGVARVDAGLGEGFVVALSPVARDRLRARPGDMVYVCDDRWWLGGLRSFHGRVTDAAPAGEREIRITPEAADWSGIRDNSAVWVEKIC